MLDSSIIIHLNDCPIVFRWLLVAVECSKKNVGEDFIFFQTKTYSLQTSAHYFIFCDLTVFLIRQDWT